MSCQVSIFRLLFPPVCAFCGKDLAVEDASRLCDFCRGSLFQDPDRRCQTCGGILAPAALDARACALCRQTRFRFTRAIALGHYQGALRAAVLRMKHASERYLACAVGELLAEHAAGQLVEDRPDLLVSVPMHWWRRLRRGGSTTEAITEVMADRMAICQAHSVFRCRRNTKKQSTLAPADRRRNVSGAYTISESYDLVDAHVGLVDDTLTTGATANELSKLLLAAGVRRVTLLVVARATGGAGS